MMTVSKTLREEPVGKGLGGALKMLKDRGDLKKTEQGGGRNMGKKKSIFHEHGDRQKEISIVRTDEYGRNLTPKEAFKRFSQEFHGKHPGKKKQEKRMRENELNFKIKRMKNIDTPSQSVERMRKVLEQTKTPFIVLSGHVKPGKISDQRSGFATVEKELRSGLTPMLGDRKIKHSLKIKRKPVTWNMAAPLPKWPLLGDNIAPKNPGK